MPRGREEGACCPRVEETAVGFSLMWCFFCFVCCFTPFFFGFYFGMVVSDEDYNSDIDAKIARTLNETCTIVGFEATDKRTCTITNLKETKKDCSKTTCGSCGCYATANQCTALASGTRTADGVSTPCCGSDQCCVRTRCEGCRKSNRRCYYSSYYDYRRKLFPEKQTRGRDLRYCYTSYYYDNCCTRPCAQYSTKSCTLKWASCWDFVWDFTLDGSSNTYPAHEKQCGFSDAGCADSTRTTYANGAKPDCWFLPDDAATIDSFAAAKGQVDFVSPSMWKVYVYYKRTVQPDQKWEHPTKYSHADGTALSSWIATKKARFPKGQDVICYYDPVDHEVTWEDPNTLNDNKKDASRGWGGAGFGIACLILGVLPLLMLCCMCCGNCMENMDLDFGGEDVPAQQTEIPPKNPVVMTRTTQPQDSDFVVGTVMAQQPQPQPYAGTGAVPAPAVPVQPYYAGADALPVATATAVPYSANQL